MHYSVLCRLAWIYRLPRSISIIMGVVACFSIFGSFWNLLEASGVGGSPSLSIALLLGIIFVVSIGVFLARCMHWTLLFWAVKSYVDQHLKQVLSKEGMILLGIGPGGALSVGMVAKALRNLRMDPPSCLVLDMRYVEKGKDPEIGKIIPADMKLPKDKCFIVQGNVNTGRSLRRFREQYGLKECPVFAFVVSEGAKNTEDLKHIMMVGHRSILPWETEAAPKDGGGEPNA